MINKYIIEILNLKKTNTAIVAFDDLYSKVWVLLRLEVVFDCQAILRYRTLFSVVN